MKLKSKKRRQIISATLDPKYIRWLEALSEQTSIPKSRLLEKSIELLKKEEAFKKQKKQMDAINKGIDRMLEEEGEDLMEMADSGFTPRVGAELL